MTLAIEIITPGRLALVAFNVSRFAGLILALVLALLGLAADMVILPGPVGFIALWPALVGLALATAVMVEEISEGMKRC